MNKKTKFVERKDKENLGKHYLRRGLDFALEKNFGKAYEFFKEGLDYLTCDCGRGGWLNKFKKSDMSLFNDIEYSNVNHKEYFFTKALLLSYHENKKELYLALDAIEKYIKITDDEYGHYIHGKILLSLEEPEKALRSFNSARILSDNPRIKYRIGRTKEQYLNEYGLDQLFESFVGNFSSACCLRVLHKEIRSYELKIKIGERFEDNILLKSFIEEDDEWSFQDEFEKMLKYETVDDVPFDQATLPIIENFVDVLIQNSELFLMDEEYDNDESFDTYEEYGYGESYEKYGGYNGYSDDVIDDAFEGDPTNTWNVD